MEAAVPPRLRGVKKCDLAAIAELEATAFGTNSLTHSALDVLFDQSGAFWFLAEDDEGVWGHTVSARAEDPHVGWILGMAIHPERQRRGWGKYLLQSSIDRMHDYDIDIIRLLVKPNNKIARRLYENFGFIETGERTDHFGPGEDRMLMSLLLSPNRGARPLVATGFPLPQDLVDPDPF